MLKEELTDVLGQVFCFPDLGVTVAMMPRFAGSTRARFAFAKMGSGETKFRRKVGELVAIRRLFAGESLSLARDVGADVVAREFAEFIAYQ